MSKKWIIIMVLVLIMGVFFVSCAPDEADVPAEEPEEPEEAISDKHGGILRFAFYAPTNMDPAFLSTIADEHIARQYSDHLVFIDEENMPDINRSIAKNWESNDEAMVWTFELREGITFHDGKEMTSEDVKFTYDRLRDPDIGAATVDMYSNIVDITTPDDYTVIFELEESNVDFLLDLADYHALVMDTDNPDFNTNFNGTGPFMVERY